MARITRALRVARLQADFTRGLRFRLSLSYVLFFSVLLVAIGLLFRQSLMSAMDDEARELLEEEWGAVKGYLRIENQRPIWFFDRYDPEEAWIVSRLQRVYMLTDVQGIALEYSDIGRALGLDNAADVGDVLSRQDSVVRFKYDRNGVPYVIKEGTLPDEAGRKYFLAIGRSLETGRRAVYRFTWNYFAVVPALIAISGLLGWWLAARALWPVNSVAQTAQRISGFNLNMRIPLRGAGDELDHLIDCFNRMMERLHESFEQIRRFSTDVSHELRTPLTAIRGQLEVALFTAQTPEQYREAMISALQDVEQLSNIVRALLLLSQAESGQLVLQKAPLDLAAEAADVVDQYQIPAEAARVTLSASLADGCIIRADRTQIGRLLSNLLSNAIKYTTEGGSVHVSLEAENGWAKLSVTDTGVGIPEANLPHIFDRFYRVRNPRTSAAQGLGLGLSFVAWIVEAHGGKIDVESTVGEGSTFRVWLPLGEAPPAIETPEPQAVPEKLH